MWTPPGANGTTKLCQTVRPEFFYFSVYEPSYLQFPSIRKKIKFSLGIFIYFQVFFLLFYKPANFIFWVILQFCCCEIFYLLSVITESITKPAVHVWVQLFFYPTCKPTCFEQRHFTKRYCVTCMNTLYYFYLQWSDTIIKMKSSIPFTWNRHCRNWSLGIFLNELNIFNYFFIFFSSLLPSTFDENVRKPKN